MLPCNGQHGMNRVGCRDSTIHGKEILLSKSVSEFLFWKHVKWLVFHIYFYIACSYLYRNDQWRRHESHNQSVQSAERGVGSRLGWTYWNDWFPYAYYGSRFFMYMFIIFGVKFCSLYVFLFFTHRYRSVYIGIHIFHLLTASSLIEVIVQQSMCKVIRRRDNTAGAVSVNTYTS